MLALKIILGIILFIVYAVMMSMMIIFERDKPKNIIIWSIVFLTTQIVGYVIYICLRQVYYKKKNSLLIKQKEDEIFKNLISNNLKDNSVDTTHDLLSFNQLAFNANLTVNNNYELFTDYENTKENLLKDLADAKKYILLELAKIDAIDFEEIKNILIEKAKAGIMVRFIHAKNMNRKVKNELMKAGVKTHKFSKYNTIGKVYSNLRNVISIDGKVVYLANLNFSKRQLVGDAEVANVFVKLKGDVLQDINIAIHQDTIFASGKHIDYFTETEQLSNKTQLQFVSNEVNEDLELLLIKAICMAKKSIQLQLAQFIPTESLMSLLRFAINSNIQVRLMVPLKNDKHGKYYATRAYAKELALFGANVYLYDGYIRFNAITVDNDYVIYGSYIVDREHLNTSLQNMLLIKDSKAVKVFNETFDRCVENSYRINNAKYMLLMEKFFKNFV